MATLSPTIFREYDVRGVAGQDLTEEAVTLVARALAAKIRGAGGRRAAVGRDARLSSPRFAEAVVGALTASGVDVLDLGVVPTPLVYFAALAHRMDGYCAVTASHNPAEYNGLKLGVGGVTLHGAAIQELRRIALEGRFPEGRGVVTPLDVTGEYLRFARERLAPGPRRLKVVVDAGNGTGGLVAVPLLRSMGAEVVPLFVEPDGRFPNHHADPTVEENLAHLRAKVLEERADLGVAYDGDADRVGAVDERGRVVWGDTLVLLFARAVLAERPGATVVAEVKCSMTLFDEVRRLGGRALMSKAGHSIVKERMKAEGAPLGGEMSGHVFFADRWPGFDDGVYASARLVELLSREERPLSALLDALPRTESTPELRVPCPEDKKFEVVRRAQEWFSTRHETVTVDGVRVIFPDGWGLVRASNTQPLLVLRFEARTRGRLAEIRALVEGKVAELLREVGA